MILRECFLKRYERFREAIDLLKELTTMDREEVF